MQRDEEEGEHADARTRKKTEAEQPGDGGDAGDGRFSEEQEEALQALRDRIKELQDQVQARAEEEKMYDAEAKDYMEALHQYNELKDIGQMLMGKLATLEGLLTRDLYVRYDLKWED
ncbi:swi5-like zinc finger protein [Balamuthia mandrillaris]